MAIQNPVTITGVDSAGNSAEITVEGGAAHVIDVGSGGLLTSIEDGAGAVKTVATDILPIMYHDSALASAGSEAAPAAGDMTDTDFTLATHSTKTISASAIVVTCSGGSSDFEGCVITINQSSTTTAAAAAAEGSFLESFFCPPGITLIPYNQVISHVYHLAYGSATNKIQITPL